MSNRLERIKADKLKAEQLKIERRRDQKALQVEYRSASKEASAISDVLSGYELFKRSGQALKNKSDQKPSPAVKTYIKPSYDDNEYSRPVTAGQNTITNSEPEPVPEEVLALIDDKNYLPRHSKLAREHGADYLLKVAEFAQKKNKPSHWYAKVTSVKQWQAVTLPMLEKLFNAIKRATLAMQKLNIDMQWLRYYTGVAYRTTEAVFAGLVEQATTSAKTSPQQYFKYLSTTV